MINTLSGLIIPGNIDYIVITTSSYHYGSILEFVSESIHIEKVLAHRIKDSSKEKELDMAKKMIRFLFLQNEKNLMDLGRNSDPIADLVSAKNKTDRVDIMLEKVTSQYGYDSTIPNFLSFMKRNRKEVFL